MPFSNDTMRCLALVEPFLSMGLGTLPEPALGGKAAVGTAKTWLKVRKGRVVDPRALGQCARSDAGRKNCRNMKTNPAGPVRTPAINPGLPEKIIVRLSRCFHEIADTARTLNADL